MCMYIHMESVQVWVFIGGRQQWLNPNAYRFVLTIPALPVYEQSKGAGTSTEKEDGLSL